MNPEEMNHKYEIRLIPIPIPIPIQFDFPNHFPEFFFHCGIPFFLICYSFFFLFRLNDSRKRKRKVYNIRFYIIILQNPAIDIHTEAKRPHFLR